MFIAAELVSITTGETADSILPIGALLTAIGMTMAGAPVIGEHRWHGWRRFTPLAMGLYPVVFMFPLAATDAPVEPSIALWALPTVAVGIAALSSRPTTSPTTSTRDQLGETVRGGRGH